MVDKGLELKVGDVVRLIDDYTRANEARFEVLDVIPTNKYNWPGYVKLKILNPTDVGWTNTNNETTVFITAIKEIL